MNKKKVIKKYTDFTNLFRRDITLRMRLEPVTFVNGEMSFLKQSLIEITDKDGKTKLTTNDEDFYQSYKNLKPIIDKYHQYYIQNSLDVFADLALKEHQNYIKDSKNRSESFISLICRLAELSNEKKEDEDKEEERKKKVGEIAIQLCAQISNHLKDDSKNHYFTKTILQEDGTKKEFGFAKLFSKEFLVSELENFATETSILTSEETVQINSIKKDATRMAQYCDKLFTSRKNVYGMKKNSVSYRCIHENLFRFLGICNKAKRLCKELDEDNSLSYHLATKIHAISKDVHSISDIFTPAMYCQFLSQDGIDKFNTIISSLNSTINQIPPKERKEKKLHTLKVLHKQILSDKDVVIDVITNDLELEEKIQSVISSLNILGMLGENVNNKVQELLNDLKDGNKAQIYLSTNNLYPISVALLNDGMKLRNMVEWKRDNTPKKKIVSIQEINQYIQETLESDIDVCNYFTNLKTKDAHSENMENIFVLLKRRFKDYYAHESMPLYGERKTAFKRLMDVIIALNRALKALECPESAIEFDGIFYAKYDEITKELRNIDRNYNLIRNYILRTKDREEQFPLYFGEDAKEFLNGFTVADDSHGTRHRGYLFRKETGRIDNETFYDYFIGIANYHKFFPRRKNSEKIEGDCDMQHLVYYQTTQDTFKKQFIIANGEQESMTLSDTNLRNWIIDNLKKEYGHSAISFLYKGATDELNATSSSLKGLMHQIKINSPKIYDALLKNKDFKRRDKLFVDQLTKAAHSVERLKEFVDYAPKEKHSWEVKEELANMVDTCSSKCYEYVSIKDLDEAISGVEKSGVVRRMHFFRISNKDLNYFVPNKTLIGNIQRKDEPLRKSHGRENLHTLFFRSMMNEKETIFDLGAGKIMYRRASIERKETHEPGKLKNKNKLNTKKYSDFKYSLYKDKRFTRDQMTLHLSITQNYKVPYNSNILKLLNESVREYLDITKEKYNIIGIDRGERNLLYVTLMKPNGTIIRQKSLNVITDDKHNLSTDYHQQLKEKVDKIKQQKADWDEIDNISNLKEGYLSQAVHEIAKMAVDNKAIIVMEKLSEGFKSTRQKYLSNVYQLFERMLVRKLSYYTDKTIDKNVPGGVLNALQLVAEDSVDLNQNDDKVVQNGIIFFVPAWMTSKIDPITGFTNLFTFGGIKTLKDARELLSSFSSIGYDKKKKEFVFSFDYRNFGVNIDSVNKWIIGTHGKRVVSTRNENGYPSRKTIDLTEEFMKFFKKYELEISDDMRTAICNYNVIEHPSISDKLKKLENKYFFEELLKYIRYTVQLRNSDSDASDEKEKDYIISPVIKADEKFYLSSNYLNVESKDKQEKAKLPVDSDANGAYNIARKGIIVLQQIKEKKNILKISEKGWLAFAQKTYKDSIK